MRTNYFSGVMKSGGKLEQYDYKKILASLNKANSSGDDYKKINEVAEKVEKVLMCTFLPGSIISSDLIGKTIEASLGELSLHRTLKVFNQFLVSKQKTRKNLKVAKQSSKKADVTDFTLLVETDSSSQLFEWDRKKIADALVKEARINNKDAHQIAKNVEKKIISSGLKKITTSLIREIVDNELLSLGYVANLKRQVSLGIPTYNLEQIIFSKSQENSNIAAHNPEAVNLAIAETTLKQYALNNIFSKEVADAHLEGRIHLHDLGYPTRVYCSSHSLEYIKKYGLKLENLEIVSSPAKHARTLTGHLNTFLASMQAYYAGALGIGYINIFYAPYLVGMSYEEMLQEAQYLIFSLSQSAFSRGGQVLFLDANIHTGIPSYLKKIPAIGPGGVATGKVYDDYEKESQLFALALLEVWRKGDSNGNLFAFPKCDLHINSETFTDPAQRRILEYACEVASENGTPYFIFDRDEVTLSACCRLRTTITDNYMIEHPESMRFCGFQNVTINLPQCAYRAGKNNLDGLLKEIYADMNIAVRAHLEKKKFIGRLMSEKNLPLWQIGKLALDDRPYVALETATYIVGIIGLNECVQHITGRQLHEDPDVFKLGLKIISAMFIKSKELGQKHNLKISLEESPAESASRRLAKVDLHKFKEAKDVIKGNHSADEFYYTNSIHFAADAPVNLFERIEKQSKFHPLIESGAIIHAFIGEESPQPAAVYDLIKKTWENTKAAQLTISPEFTICFICNKHTRGLKDSCIYCGSTAVYGITRVVGYFSRITNWNKSKKGELKDRHKGDYALNSRATQQHSDIATDYVAAGLPSRKLSHSSALLS